MLSNDENMLKERIRHLLKHKRKTVADLSNNETLRVRYRRQINGEAAVPYSTIVLILEMFHDISADWLVMGEGSMCKADHIAPRVYTQNNNVQGNTAGGDIKVGGVNTAPSLQEVDKMKARIAELERDKAMLQNVIAAFTAGLQK